jgi:SEC-C motif/Protein of unknown function (DUF1186)
MKYSDNVDKLLTYAEFNWGDDWLNYAELDFTPNDIPALLKLAQDDDLYKVDDNLINAAPDHAWRILGLLKAEEAILPLLAYIDDEDSDCEMVIDILGLIGEKAIFPIKNYLYNSEVCEENKGVAIEALDRIVKNYPEFKGQCLDIFIEILTQITEQESYVASFIVCSLMDLNVRESINEIRAAFERGCIDISISGDLEEVEIVMGFRKERSTPKPDYHKLGGLSFEEILRRTLNVDERKLDSKDNIKPVSKPKPIEHVLKIGRNDPCPCGSGKKYKKCCLH